MACDEDVDIEEIATKVSVKSDFAKVLDNHFFLLIIERRLFRSRGSCYLPRGSFDSYGRKCLHRFGKFHL